MVVCHALTKELHVMEIAKVGPEVIRNDKIELTHPALPSFMAYISAVFLASFCMPLPNSSSSMARFLKNTDASCRGEGESDGKVTVNDVQGNAKAA
jgi:hypothetical protein